MQRVSRSRHVTGYVLLTVACIWGCSSGGGGGGSPVSSPEEGIFAGTVVDASGAPVAGARVSIAGVEAQALTDSRGNFYVSDASLAVPPAGPGKAAAVAGLDIAVLVPGYDPQVLPLVVESGERAAIEFTGEALEPDLTVTSPTGDKVITVPASCPNPRVLVEGYARLARTESFRLDVVVVIDRSGSTAREAFDIDGDEVPETVLEAEISATECFLQSLDPDTSRVAVVQFNNVADVVRDFTDPAGATDALAVVDGPALATNYEAAFAQARDLFLGLEAEDQLAELAEPAEDPAPEIPDPFRAVVFLSDGVPTLHGVPPDPDENGLVQSREDREASIAAAENLGEQTGAEIFGFSILPALDSNLPRTTLPHCTSACGGGAYQNIADVSQLESALCGKPLVSFLSVELTNLTMGGEPVVAELYPDGFFSELVPVTLAAPAGRHGTVENTLEVSLTSFGGDSSLVDTETVSVLLIAEGDLNDLSKDEVESTQSAPTPVSDLTELTGPTGSPLGSDALYDFLEGEYEDAVELRGVDTFHVVDPDGLDGAVTVQVDFAFKQACYKSDFGYIVIDPEDPPRSAGNALAHATAANILYNSGDIGEGDCSLQSIAAGTAEFQVELQHGQVLVFFILPNRTLSEYQANPKGRLKPLFTIPSLNPGGFDQVLSFRSLNGRTEPGASETVLTPGPMSVLAFEDLAIADGSDQDFTDVVFSVTNVVGRVDALKCE